MALLAAVNHPKKNLSWHTQGAGEDPADANRTEAHDSDLELGRSESARPLRRKGSGPRLASQNGPVTFLSNNFRKQRHPQRPSAPANRSEAPSLHEASD
jgi:hypothetical protein